MSEFAAAADEGWPVVVPVGTRLGDWEVTAPLAPGGWGSVYRARRAGAPPGTPEVALKVLSTVSLAPGAGALLAEAARREVAFSRRAEHPHVVRLFATLRIDDPCLPTLRGAVVLVMELAERSLRDLLAHAAPGSALPQAGRLLRETSEGLAFIHALGWVHGDLKPDNVLVMADDSVRLADFGLAGELEGTHAYLPQAGSTDYLPPEWWSEQTAEHGVATRPSRDVWAFGVLAHQLLTGGLHPLPGATARARAAAAQAYGQGRAPLRLAQGLPAPWAPLLRECLAPDHASRAGLHARALQARVAVAVASGTPARSGKAVPAPARVRRLRIVAALMAAALLGAACGTLVTRAVTGPEEPAADRAVTSTAAPPPAASGSAAAAQDLSGDGRPDLVLRAADGILTRYDGRDGGTFAPGQRIGSGYDRYTHLVVSPDLTGDRLPDAVGRDAAGRVWLHRGTPQHRFAAAAEQIAQGWNDVVEIIPAGDFLADGKADLLVRDSAARLFRYDGLGTGFFAAAPLQIGGGWHVYAAVVCPGDLTGDGRPDLLGQRNDGQLIRYDGTGNGFARPGVPIDGGWGHFTAVIGADIDRDGAVDLLARDRSGQLAWRRGAGDGTLLAGWQPAGAAIDPTASVS